MAASLLAAYACTGEPARGAQSAADGAPSHAGAQEAPVRYDTLPPSGRFVGGSVLMQADGRPTSFVFSQVRTRRGDVLRLDSVVAGVPRNRSRIIRAELSIPPMAADEHLLIGSCDAGDHLDPALVAIVVADSGAARYTRIRQAWRARPANDRFEVVPIRGITCEDTGGG